MVRLSRVRMMILGDYAGALQWNTACPLWLFREIKVGVEAETTQFVSPGDSIPLRTIEHPVKQGNEKGHE